MWEFNEQEKDIKWLGYLNVDNTNYLLQIQKIKKNENEDDIYLLQYNNGFKLIKINQK